MSLINVDDAMLVDGEVEVATTSDVDPTVAQLQALLHQRGHNIDTLQAEVVRLKQQVEEAKAAHANDVAQIGSWLQSEARERDWCEDYDDCVDTVNSRLMVKLPNRRRDFKVTMRVTYEVSRTVHEDSADSAWDYVNEDWEQVDRLVRNAEPENVERVSVTQVED